jgi:hypothetical protein
MVAKKIINHLLSLALITAALIILNYPILLNADFFLQFDEAAQAAFTVNLMKGSPLTSYYPNVSHFSYHGILHGLFAIPFFWLIGKSASAYKLAAVLFYAVHTWGTCWISGKINPKAPFLVGLLMVFCSPVMVYIATHNWSNSVILSLGSLSLVLFIQCYKSREKLTLKIFLLFFTMGLSIYAYTYSIVYVTTIFFIFILTSTWWKNTRSNFNLSRVSIGWKNGWKNLENKRLRLVRLLDLIILCFLFATIFGYIWGGFAIDIMGTSIFQIKNFHKPAIQVLVLLMIRLLIYRQDLPIIFQKVRALVQNTNARMKTLIACGIAGFTFGILPRIIGVLNGEVVSGGQGFDLNLDFFRLLEHLKIIFFIRIPDLFGVYSPLKEIFADANTDWFLKNILLDTENDPFFPVIGILSFVMIGLFAVAGYSFFKVYLNTWKNIFKIKSCRFDPILIITVLPILVCLANMLKEDGPLTVRYLYPIYSVVVIWVAIFLLRIKDKSKFSFVALIVIWVVFYSLNNYRFYRDIGVVRGLTSVEKKFDLRAVKHFLNSEGIGIAYAGYWTAVRAHLIDQKPLVFSIAERPYYYNVFPNPDLLKPQPFAVILNEEGQQYYTDYLDRYAVRKINQKILGDSPETISYSRLLEKKGIKFKKNRMGSFTIIWDFRGDDSDIEDLWKALKAPSLQKNSSANLGKSLKNLFKPKYATD